MNQEECLQIVRVLVWWQQYSNTAIQQYWLPKGFFQQQQKYPYVKLSTDKSSLWTRFHVQVLLVFAHIVSEYEVASCVSTFVAGSCQTVVVSFSWGRALPSLWYSSLRAVCSAVWHWRLLASSFESLLCFLTCFFRPATLLTTFSCFTAELKPSLALLFCFRGKSCSSLIMHVACEHEVGACTRGILVLSRSFHSKWYVFVLKKLQKGNSRKCFIMIS